MRGFAATARTSRSKRLAWTSRPTPATVYAPAGSPRRPRTAARTAGSWRKRAGSMPFGARWMRSSATPHSRSRRATVADTAAVPLPSRSVARYSARVPVLSGLPSICDSPSECSVATTARTPARRAAILPYTHARYRWVCTTSKPPARITRTRRCTARRSRFPAMPKWVTAVPSALIPSATAPGFVNVTTRHSTFSGGKCRNNNRNCPSAPPTPSPVITCTTFTTCPPDRAPTAPARVRGGRSRSSPRPWGWLRCVCPCRSAVACRAVPRAPGGGCARCTGAGASWLRARFPAPLGVVAPVALVRVRA
ncbi:exported hypothetical protein [Actinacidiphila bryophytorum]|uniref:Uncharacterized protein n=1 Tax=Actinacidiphila bryophytorum TaxID=1436133 RepID=A0A9W4H4V0_9ACTN|nr:exported hypothetical protein [Actinacidiphila bryophytorum]